MATKSWRQNSDAKYISPPDHHGQRSSQAETEVQGLCLHRQEHQFCIKRGEKTILTEDEKSNNWCSDCWGLLQRSHCKMSNWQNGPRSEFLFWHWICFTTPQYFLSCNISFLQQFKVTFRLAFPERPEEKLLLLTEKVANVDKTDGMIRKCHLSFFLILLQYKCANNFKQVNVKLLNIPLLVNRRYNL